MKPVVIFRILVIYILLQFVWWAYLLLQLHQRKWMIIGEGIVFLCLLAWFSYRTLRAFKKEVELARIQKNFLLSITHEFKSPLASIRLYLQTIQKHKGMEEAKKESFIKKAIADTERLDTLVENTLLANRITQGKSDDMLLNKEPVNLSALVRLVIQKFNVLPETKHEIKYDLEEDVVIHGDKLALQLLLNNLIENAIKYSPQNDLIRVQLKIIEAGQVSLTVTDSGIGIPDKEKKKIFEKFYRIGNEEVRKTKGTGLGLYLSKYIAEKHNGMITIRDNQPSGAVFEVVMKNLQVK